MHSMSRCARGAPPLRRRRPSAPRAAAVQDCAGRRWRQGAQRAPDGPRLTRTPCCLPADTRAPGTPAQAAGAAGLGGCTTRRRSGCAGARGMRRRGTPGTSHAVSRCSAVPCIDFQPHPRCVLCVLSGCVLIPPRGRPRRRAGATPEGARRAAPHTAPARLLSERRGHADRRTPLRTRSRASSRPPRPPRSSARTPTRCSCRCCGTPAAPVQRRRAAAWHAARARPPLMPPHPAPVVVLL